MEGDDTHKKRKLFEIEQWREAALAALPPLPDKLEPNATEEQTETRREQIAERVRQRNKITSHVAYVRRTLGDSRSAEQIDAKKAANVVSNAARPKGDDRSAAQVAAQEATNVARPKGDDRSAAQVAAQEAANVARPKGDDRSAAQVAAQKAADAARLKDSDRKRKQVLAKDAANAKRFPQKTSGFAHQVKNASIHFYCFF